MPEALSPSTRPRAATTQPDAARLFGVVMAAVAPLKAFVERGSRFTVGGRQRRRARVLAAAQQADAAECARAFSRLLTDPG